MWSDNETTQDLLGYQVHADLLKKIILNDDMLPISIGVFGNWGSGKSSLMLLLQQSLHEWEKSQQNEKHKIILQVYFNSWQFESYDSTKLTMIESILEALDKDINKRKDVFERVDDFLERINFLKSGSLTGPSGLIVVDIDHLDSRGEAEKLKRQLFDDRLLRPVLAFTSPGGRGVKAFIPYDLARIPDTRQNTSENIHWAMNYVQAIYDSHPDGEDKKTNRSGKGVDRSGKDLVRACFLSYDEEALIRREI